MPDREFDLIIYGATGFTGRLVAQHLRGRAPADLRWAMAGRNTEKLQQLAAQIGAADIPLVIADSSDPATLRAMAESAKVVCTTVGPYATYGTQVVQACVAAGTDYCDLTGEVQWIRQMIDTYQERAERSGARIVHTCGFDSIPSDIGTLYAQTQMHQRHGIHAGNVRFRLKAARGGASGGTINSLINVIAEATEDRSVRRIMADPYALNPPGERQGPDGNDMVRPQYDPAFDQWVGPFVMAAVNTRVVRRTNALLDYPWGRDFRYEEGMLMGEGPWGAAKAAGLGLTLTGGMAALSIGPVRSLAERLVPESGGPGEKARERGFFDIRIRAEHPTDERLGLTVKVVGDQDPGYGSTSKMLTEAALSLAASQGTVGGGHWTPASALGPDLLRRLPEHAGVSFTVLDEGGAVP